MEWNRSLPWDPAIAPARTSGRGRILRFGKASSEYPRPVWSDRAPRIERNGAPPRPTRFCGLPDALPVDDSADVVYASQIITGRYAALSSGRD